MTHSRWLTNRAVLIGLVVGALVCAVWFGKPSRDVASTISAPSAATNVARDVEQPKRVEPNPDAPPSRSWTGRVLAADTGAPVADAVVRVRRYLENAKPVETRSAADGTFRLDDLVAGDSKVVVAPREFASVEFDVDVKPDMRRDVFVPTGVVLTGRVLDGASPVAGAVVARDDGVASAPTGNDGAYRLVVGTGVVSLHVTAPGIEPQGESISVPAGATHFERDVSVEHPWRVHGRVMADGKPVAGATVSVLQMQSTHDPATTDALGAFALTSFCGHDSTLVAFDRDARWAESETLVFAESRDVAEDVVIELAAPLVVRGLVHDDAGKPVAGAKIRVIVNEYRGGPPPFEFSSGADGRFETKLPKGGWQGVVSADGFFTSVQGHVEPPPMIPYPSATFLEFDLKRGGDVAGRVVDNAGAPVAGVEVSSCRGDVDFDVTTDADGCFALRRMPEAKQRVMIWKPGYVRNSALDIDATTGIADLVIDRESVIRGVVLLADGVTPAKTFEVRLYFEADDKGEPWLTPWWPFEHVQFNDADGRFEFRGVCPGTIRVEAASGTLITPRAPGHVLREGGAPTDVRLVLRLGARIAGRIVDSSRRPLANVAVRGGTLTWEDENFRDDFAAHTDIDGRFDVAGLVDGRYMLEAIDVDETRKPAQFPNREVRFSLAASETATPEIVLYRPGHLVVKVVDADGKAVEGGIEFVGPDGEPTKACGADDDVAPGKYVVRVYADGFASVDTPVEIEEGKTSTITIVLRRP